MNSTHGRMAELLFEAGVQRLRRKMEGQRKKAAKRLLKHGKLPTRQQRLSYKGSKAQLKHKEDRTPFKDEEDFANTLADKWKGQQSPDIEKAEKHRRGERHAVTNLLKHVMRKAPDEKAAGEGTQNVYSILRVGHGMARPDIVAAERERQARRN